MRIISLTTVFAFFLSASAQSGTKPLELYDEESGYLSGPEVSLAGRDLTIDYTSNVRSFPKSLQMLESSSLLIDEVFRTRFGDVREVWGSFSSPWPRYRLELTKLKGAISKESRTFQLHVGVPFPTKHIREFWTSNPLVFAEKNASLESIRGSVWRDGSVFIQSAISKAFAMEASLQANRDLVELAASAWSTAKRASSKNKRLKRTLVESRSKLQRIFLLMIRKIIAADDGLHEQLKNSELLMDDIYRDYPKPKRRVRMLRVVLAAWLKAEHQLLTGLVQGKQLETNSQIFEIAENAVVQCSEYRRDERRRQESSDPFGELFKEIMVGPDFYGDRP